MAKILKILLSAALAFVTITLFAAPAAPTALGQAYAASALADTGAANAVTAIYLNYRMYDSIFETLILLVSVSAVIHFSWRKDYE
jgi:multicomponent Na+:H+ antiporter subunit B